MFAIINFIQHYFDYSTQSNSVSKWNRHSNWKRKGKTMSICRWHDPVWRKIIMNFDYYPKLMKIFWGIKLIQQNYTTQIWYIKINYFSAHKQWKIQKWNQETTTYGSNKHNKILRNKLTKMSIKCILWKPQNCWKKLMKNKKMEILHHELEYLTLTLPKFNHEFNVIPIKITTGFFAENNK